MTRSVTNPRLWRAVADESGGMTVFGLYITLIALVIGGLALDVSNAIRMRTMLQMTADSAAHAALVVRETGTAEEAAAAAMEVVEGIMPSELYGDTVLASDIVFGTWDDTTGSFTANPSSRNAVLVDANQIAERQNSVGVFLMQFVGRDDWSILRRSVFTTYLPSCFREGLVAEHYVAVSSGNYYEKGFCIHANDFVELNSGNTFEEGVIVSMPNHTDVVLPTSGMDSNPGLPAALRDGSYHLRIVARINDIIAGVQSSGSIYFPSYLTTATAVALNDKAKIDASVWQEGRVHTLTCKNSKNMVPVEAGTILRNGVLVTNCTISFGQGTILENVVMVNSSTEVDSFTAAQGLQLGRDDNCASGGGAQLVTLGGVKIPQGLRLFGGQILAAGDVSFTSDAGGYEGGSIVSGGSIDGTTNSLMGACGGTGMEDNFTAWYFRMAA
jgi:Flp pilus assembly protein TadG